MNSNNCYANRNLLSSAEVIQNQLVLASDSTISVLAKNVVVGGGDRKREDNYLNIDPAISQNGKGVGIQTTFQEAIENDLIYLPATENILFENLYLDNKTVETDKLVTEIVEKTCSSFPNLKVVTTLSSVNKKGKINNPTTKRLNESFDTLEFEKGEELISPSKPYYQSSGEEIKAKQFKLTNYKIIHPNKPVNDRCCHHEQTTTN
jgi:hypothetical protein